MHNKTLPRTPKVKELYALGGKKFKGVIYMPASKIPFKGKVLAIVRYFIQHEGCSVRVVQDINRAGRTMADEYRLSEAS